MTKRDETNLKNILSKFATVDGFLDCLKQLEEYAANTYIDEECCYVIDFNSDAHFVIEHIKDNYYKIGFSYKSDWFNIGFLQTAWMAPSQRFAELLVREAKEIFERLDAELREEREQEFASKISKFNNKIKYVSKVSELKDIDGAELAKEQIQKAVEYSPDSTEEEFIEINNNYIKPSAVVAIYEAVYEDSCVKIILEGGKEIKIKYAFAANVFDFLVKNKESFSKIEDAHITAYIRPEHAVAIYADTNYEYNAICVTLKYGGKVLLFPANRYTADEILEKLKKGVK